MCCEFDGTNQTTSYGGINTLKSNIYQNGTSFQSRSIKNLMQETKKPITFQSNTPLQLEKDWNLDECLTWYLCSEMVFNINEGDYQLQESAFSEFGDDKQICSNKTLPK